MTHLQDHSAGIVPVHDVLHDRLEDALIGLVVNVVFEREIECVVATRPSTHILQKMAPERQREL